MHVPPALSPRLQLPGTWAFRSGQTLTEWLLLTELDALGALVLGVDPAGLTAVYNSQFPVLRAYEHQMVFDAKGRQLCGDWHRWISSERSLKKSVLVPVTTETSTLRQAPSDAQQTQHWETQEL